MVYAEAYSTGMIFIIEQRRIGVPVGSLMAVQMSISRYNCGRTLDFVHFVLAKNIRNL